MQLYSCLQKMAQTYYLLVINIKQNINEKTNLLFNLQNFLFTRLLFLRDFSSKMEGTPTTFSKKYGGELIYIEVFFWLVIKRWNVTAQWEDNILELWAWTQYQNPVSEPSIRLRISGFAVGDHVVEMAALPFPCNGPMLGCGNLPLCLSINLVVVLSLISIYFLLGTA